MEPRLTATWVVRSPRYCGHFFCPPGKTTIHFLWEKKTLVNTVTSLIRPNIFWPIGDRINGVPNQNFRNRQLLPRLQRSRRETLEADNFLSDRKSFVHWQLSLVSSSPKNFLTQRSRNATLTQRFPRLSSFLLVRRTLLDHTKNDSDRRLGFAWIMRN